MNDSTNDISSPSKSRRQQNHVLNEDDVDPITITANDAILTKLSASQMGYYEDPFLPFLAKDAVGLTSSSSSSSSHTVSSRRSTSTTTSSLFMGNDPQRSGEIGRRFTQSSSLYTSTTSSSTGTRTSTSFWNENYTHCAADERSTTNTTTVGHMPLSKRVSQQQTHQPVIRRGTHARVCVVDYAITNFLSLCDDCHDVVEQVQIVILGSGRDTTYLRSQTELLHSRTKRSSSTVGNKCQVKWYEVDHVSVIQNKYNLLCSCPLFDFKSETVLGHDSKETLVSFKITPQRIRVALEETSVHDTTTSYEESTTMNDSCPPILDPYYLISYNLLHSFQSLLQDMEQQYDFDRNIPTLFIMECVQMYLPQSNSCEILQTMTGTCRYPFLAIFDPIIQNDPFGRVMAQNLAKARIADSSMSLLQTRTLKEQVDKLYQCGFVNVTGCDFYGAYEMVLSKEDRIRANRMEMLDEIEEWILIMRHYCFLVASGGTIISNNNTHDDKEEDVTMKAILRAYCSVEEGNIFGFSQPKCMTRAFMTTTS